jgi:hypothetical protein
MKTRIAVRVPKEPRRRLYVVEDSGLSVEEMRAAVLEQVPEASVILIEVPNRDLVLEAA